jgi:hypothetical protein
MKGFRINKTHKLASHFTESKKTDNGSELLKSEDYALFDFKKGVKSVQTSHKHGMAIRTTSSAQEDFY